ncbi:MAG: hypothetical protein IJS73_02720 [Paludibacteraceae bacterium]|nr:hypothetical protein [Paludibacteraceae bacterium]
MLAVSCKQDISIQTELPIRFSLPVEGQLGPNKVRAVMGDPGQTETFAYPEYAYVFAVLRLQTGTQKVICQTDIQLTEGSWETSTYHGSLRTSDNAIYAYNKSLKLGLPKEGISSAKIYVAMSKTQLTLNNYNPTTENEVLDITFTLDDALQPFLGQIYSTPYNYKPDGTTYYGEITDISQGNYIDLLLYHVASKVDFIWNIPQDKQQQIKITNITAKNLYEGECYMFKPMALRHGTLSSGYDLQLANDVAGTWWSGREYFYTIPYQTVDNVFPLQLQFSIKTNETSTYNLTMRKNMTAADEVFVPWVRGQLTLTQPKSGSEVIEVE